MLNCFRLMLALCATVLTFFTPFISALPQTLSTRAVAVKILPLGDSITWGYQGTEPHSTNGYRKQLKDRLLASNIATDFVGTVSSGHMLDNQNEGHPGWTIRQIQNVSGPALATNPDVVLLHAGTNDLNKAETQDEPYCGASARLKSLLADVFKAKPDVTVIVAKIILTNKGEVNQRILKYNKEVGEIAKELRAQGKKIVVANQGLVKDGDLGDGIHPNDKGYVHMGNIWYDAFMAARKKGWIKT
ncbi:SGNH hydrolase [Byssothecium circinans]|uniref:SGNH hydrolase n=1 Tax=Byssothecium circinans TaxID=147558 RepID=A0A6A5UP93_9PLEO|nr:SGNH hydrolase [Byssothecium circinans]